MNKKMLIIGSDKPWYERILALAGGLCLVIPGISADLVGVALILIVFALQKFGAEKAKARTT